MDKKAFTHILHLAGVAPRYGDQVLAEVYSVGTVHKRKDGEWIKTADGWVRLTKDRKATSGAGGSAASAPVPQATSGASPTDRALQAMKTAGASAPTTKPAEKKPDENSDEQRKANAEKLVPVITAAMKSLEDGGYDEAQVDGYFVRASFRTWDLPKDPPSEPYGDDDESDEGMDWYAYQDALEDVLKRAREGLQTKLSAHMDKIAGIKVYPGDKNWIEVAVRLK